MGLNGKVAVVTGVTSGLGRDLASVLTEQGAHVVGVGRRAERGRKLEEQLCGFHFEPCDVSRAADCQRVVDATIARLGGVDILVNNAGTVGEVAGVHEISDADWEQVLAVNLTGAFFMCRQVLPHMYRAGQGVIINIASINAVEGVAGLGAYNASKAGLVQLSRTLAVEGAERGVRVNAVVLGGVPSEMNVALKEAMGRTLRGPEWRPERPAAATISGEEAARAIALLCHDDAFAMTGGTIAIDGGVSAGRLASAMIYLVSAELLPA